MGLCRWLLRWWVTSNWCSDTGRGMLFVRLWISAGIWIIIYLECVIIYEIYFCTTRKIILWCWANGKAIIITTKSYWSTKSNEIPYNPLEELWLLTRISETTGRFQKQRHKVWTCNDFEIILVFIMLTAIIIYYYHPKFLIYFADETGVLSDGCYACGEFPNQAFRFFAEDFEFENREATEIWLHCKCPLWHNFEMDHSLRWLLRLWDSDSQLGRVRTEWNIVQPQMPATLTWRAMAKYHCRGTTFAIHPLLSVDKSRCHQTT